MSLHVTFTGHHPVSTNNNTFEQLRHSYCLSHGHWFNVHSYQNNTQCNKGVWWNFFPHFLKIILKIQMFVEYKGYVRSEWAKGWIYIAISLNLTTLWNKECMVFSLTSVWPFFNHSGNTKCTLIKPWKQYCRPDLHRAWRLWNILLGFLPTSGLCKLLLPLVVHKP